MSLPAHTCLLLRRKAWLMTSSTLISPSGQGLSSTQKTVGHPHPPATLGARSPRRRNNVRHPCRLFVRVEDAVARMTAGDVDDLLACRHAFMKWTSGPVPAAVASVGRHGGDGLGGRERGPARDFLSRQLTDDGFEVFAADRAVAVLELVESRRLDLVLLDAVLPDASGFELCGRLRAGEPGRAWDRDLPVIMVSARATRQTASAGLPAAPTTT